MGPLVVQERVAAQILSGERNIRVVQSLRVKCLRA